MVLKDNLEQLKAEKQQTQVEVKRRWALMLELQVDQIVFIILFTFQLSKKLNSKSYTVIVIHCIIHWDRIQSLVMRMCEPLLMALKLCYYKLYQCVSAFTLPALQPLCTLVLLLIARTNFSEFSNDWHNCKNQYALNHVL